MREMWKIVGIVVFSIAFGMVLTVLISNRLASLIVANKGHMPNYALSTLPDFRQLVHTCNFLDAPLTLHFTFLTFEFQI